MRETAAATGTPTEVGKESAEDLEVSAGASGSPEANEQVEQPHAGPSSTSEEVAGDGEPDQDPADRTGAALDPELAPRDQTRPTFTRPPGMTPPPDRLDEDAEPSYGQSARPSAGVGAGPTATATAPVANPATTGPAGDPHGRPNLDPAVAIGSARVNEAIRSTRATPGPRGPRRARLTIRRLDPWSVMKFSFAVSLVLFIVMIVAASVLYLALDAMGVFASVNNTLAELVEGGGGEGEGFRITASWVIGTAASLGAINVVLFTALATLGAFIYNVCSDLVGGVEVTLAERD